ncbi:CPBP family intramembrane metalloprotease [Clostridium lacusfryxellense]|nr:CPBP family intramembrane metalloprotease [Clostridium lacusfryxellense]
MLCYLLHVFCGIGEEIVFRGYLYEKLKETTNSGE